MGYVLCAVLCGWMSAAGFWCSTMALGDYGRMVMWASGLGFGVFALAFAFLAWVLAKV